MAAVAEHVAKKRRTSKRGKAAVTKAAVPKAEGKGQDQGSEVRAGAAAPRGLLPWEEEKEFKYAHCVHRRVKHLALRSSRLPRIFHELAGMFSAQHLMDSLDKLPLVYHRDRPTHYVGSEDSEDSEDSDSGYNVTIRDIVGLADCTHLFFGVHFNVCRFVDGQRENWNKAGRASGKALRKLLGQGYTLQYHQPQRHCLALRGLLSRMEEYFECLCGANVYITPAGAQGLAPHHDDIDAFVLQIEGTKLWKLYEPLEPLADSCSGDYAHADIGDPVLEVTLQPGDMMYFPRGMIHEAIAQDTLSTHVTVSTNQGWSHGAFLAQALPDAVAAAAEEHVGLRKGLRPKFLSRVGLMFEEPTPPSPPKRRLTCPLIHTPKIPTDRQGMRELLSDSKVLDTIVDNLFRGADDRGVDFVSNRLPVDIKSGPAFKPTPAEAADHANKVLAEAQEDWVVELDLPPSHLRFVAADAEAVGEKERIGVYTSRFNNFCEHMLRAPPGANEGADDGGDAESDDEGMDVGDDTPSGRAYCGALPAVCHSGVSALLDEPVSIADLHRAMRSDKGATNELLALLVGYGLATCRPLAEGETPPAALEVFSEEGEGEEEDAAEPE